MPTSADGVLKLSPGSIALGSGRVMVREAAARTMALSATLYASSPEGSVLSYVRSNVAKLRMFGYLPPSARFCVMLRASAIET